MRRFIVCMLAAAVLAPGEGARAQGGMPVTRRALMYDVGVYAGGAWSTDWFTIGDDGFAPGLSPGFGAMAAFFFTPGLGVRLHAVYTPQHLPENDDAGIDFGFGGVVNSWLYDVDLVLRPWVEREDVSDWMASAYLFVGGGGYTPDLAGESGTHQGCTQADFLANGLCVSDQPGVATVGQGVVGFGMDLVPVSSGLALFVEGAVHGYDSPAHVAQNAKNTKDRLTLTPRLVLGLKARSGDMIPPPPRLPSRPRR
ncbi:MAG TPA: hypothetical protein VF006_23570 [Longimicrobium sp.]